MHCNVYTLGSGVRLSVLDFWLSYDAKTTYGAHCYYFPAFPKWVQSQAILKTLDNNSNKLRKAGVPPLHQSHTMGVKGLGQEATQVLLPWKPIFTSVRRSCLIHTLVGKHFLSGFFPEVLFISRDLRAKKRNEEIIAIIPPFPPISIPCPEVLPTETM